MALTQVYKEQGLVVGLDPYDLPILFVGSLLVAKIEFFNPSVDFYGGKLTSFSEESIGRIYSKSASLRINQAKYLEFAVPYFPNTYRLNFLPGWWLRGRSFNLIIWEHT